MAFNPTPDQEKAILAKGDVLVSAAAGSGKTAVLVERVIKLLSDTENPLDANRLLIVTFTNAAANEMRTRIEKRLSEEIRRTGSRRLMRQRLLIYGAKICTIDSFCIDFVRDNFAKLDIQPDFKVSDFSEEQAGIRAAFEQTFNEMSTEKREGFSEMMACLSSAYGLDEFKEYLLKIFSHCRSLPFPEFWLKNIKKMYSDKAYNIWLREICHYTEQIAVAQYNSVKKCISLLVNYQDTEKYTPILNSAAVQLEDVSLAAVTGEWDKVKESLQAFSLTPLPRTKAVSEIREAVKNCKSSVTEAITSLKKVFNCSYSEACNITSISGVAVAAFIDFLLRFIELFEKHMHKAAVYPFDMIERMSLQLLCTINESGEIALKSDASELCKDFDEILVDEYQDTNDLQDTLFRILSLKNGNLFTVGDVKQSIYGFRHANPNNFLLRRERLPDYTDESKTGRIDLSCNFRSRSDICSFINFFFTQLMCDSVAGIEYSESEKLVYSADYPADANGGVEYHLLERTDSLRSREELEAAYIAGYIKRLVDSGVVLKLNGTERKVGYGDFAVLMQSPSSRAGIYAKEFRNFGVPVTIESNAFYETAEISLALSVLRVINNPTDDISLLSVIMSELFGFSADKIVEIKIAYKSDTLIGRITAAASAGDEEAISFLSKLSNLRTLASIASLGELVSRMYEETELMLMMSMRENGDKRKENLLRLLDMADNFTQDSHISTLSSFLRSLENNHSSSIKSAPQSNIDAVRIMSIHASKGLQFPYCILAGNFTKFNIKDNIGRVVVDEELGIGIKLVDKENSTMYETLPRKAISLKLHRDMIAEKIRLLYVAMTRAEYKLDIVICQNNFSGTLNSLLPYVKQDGSWDEGAILNSQGYAAWLLLGALTHKCTYESLVGFGAKGVPFTIESEEIRLTIAKPSAVEEPNTTKSDAKGDKELSAKLANNFKYQYPFSELEGIPSKLSVSELTKDSSGEFDFTLRPSFAQQSGLTAAERGTANHKFLQLCDFETAALNLDGEIERMYEYEFLSESEAEVLDKDGLNKFFVSNIFKELSKAKEIYREFPFILPYKIDQNATESSIIQGVADCIAITDQGCIILDYKTDRVTSSDELVKRYTQQVEFYANAVEQIFRLPIVKKGVYSLCLGEYIEM